MGEKGIQPVWPISSIHHLGDQIMVAWSNAAIRGWNFHLSYSWSFQQFWPTRIMVHPFLRSRFVTRNGGHAPGTSFSLHMNDYLYNTRSTLIFQFGGILVSLQVFCSTNSPTGWWANEPLCKTYERRRPGRVDRETLESPTSSCFINPAFPYLSLTGTSTWAAGSDNSAKSRTVSAPFPSYVGSVFFSF